MMSFLLMQYFSLNMLIWVNSIDGPKIIFLITEEEIRCVFDDIK